MNDELCLTTITAEHNNGGKIRTLMLFELFWRFSKICAGFEVASASQVHHSLQAEIFLIQLFSYVFSHLMVSLWHNEGRCLLLGKEGEVKNIGDGHLPSLGVHHLCRHSSLDVVILQAQCKSKTTLIFVILGMTVF